MTLTYDLVSRIVVSGAYLLFEVGIPNLLCGFILGWRRDANKFWVTFSLTLSSDLILGFSCLEHISYITNSFPQMCLMLDQLLCGHSLRYCYLSCFLFFP